MGHLSNTANTWWNPLHRLLTLSLTRTDQIWCIVTVLRDCSQHKSSIMFYCVMLHLPETLSSGAQQPAGSAHTCQHITVTFLLSTTALIGIYLQTNTGRKVSVLASALRVMTGMKVPLSLPSLGESHRDGRQSPNQQRHLSSSLLPWPTQCAQSKCQSA